MESLQERPGQRHRVRNRESDETENAAPVEEVEFDNNREDDEQIDDNDETGARATAGESTKEINDSDIRKLNSLNRVLAEQEVGFKNEQEGIEMKKQHAKEGVTNMFSHLREILEEKETELLNKIDSEFTVAGSFIADIVSNIESEKLKVTEVLDNYRVSVENDQEDYIKQITQEIDTSLDIRKDVLSQFRIPNFVLNKQSIDTVKDLHYGTFQESVNSSLHNEEEQTIPDINQEDASENSPEIVNDLNVDTIVVAETNASNETNETDIRGGDLAEGLANEPDACQEKELDARGDTVLSGDEVNTPSAPPVEPEESPPPYWQAMGLDRPNEQTQSQVEIPGYYDIQHSPNNYLPENRLELWHSFPVRRQYDRLGRMSVALSWNCGRICVADRANMSVKFFSPNGQQITEMQHSGTEIHDLTFLEESFGESRYALTSSKKQMLLIISIDARDTIKVIRKLFYGQRYTCICRGPRVQTLLGAEIGATSGTPTVVNLFTFAGQILLSIAHTPSFVFFQYIKSLEVFGNNIIVLDWKLNSVSVFQDDGKTVGEYRGTQSSPLVNPLDMTVDNRGNILILNGEFSNIHVIDLHCNPIEIIKIPRNVSPTSSSAKLIAFDTGSQRLSLARANGDIAIFTFENGYDCLPQRNLPPNVASHQSTSTTRGQRQRAPEVLPLVEGMLPSTIEDIITRQPARNRNRQFHL